MYLQPKNLLSLLTLFSVIIICNSFRISEKESQAIRIVGGEPAGQFLTSRLANVILYFTDTPDRYLCTASVIAPTWLLFAAHCLIGPGRQYTVDTNRSYAFIGDRSSFLRRENTDKVPFEIEKFYRHHKHVSNLYDFRHDIAMIKLKQKIPDYKYSPVKLAESILDRPKMNSIVNAAGYGAESAQGDKWPSHLMKTKLVLKPFHICKQLEKDQMKNYLSWSSMVCAVSVGFPKVGKTDTCIGDSGGPLFSFDKQKKEILQFAITSFSNFPCASPRSVAWYTRIDTYYYAIQRNLRGYRGHWKEIKSN